MVVLPGPPRELQPMWPVALATEPVRAVLARATPLRGYTLRMFGVPESEIAKSLREIEGDGIAIDAVEITTCLRRGEIEIDVRYRDEAEAVADAVRTGLRDRHERHLFSLDGETIDAQVAKLLAGRRLGLAESCSGGLLAARITKVPGASAYMAGSVVAYANEAKAELLGVDPALIDAKGAVSPEVAEAMAIGALERFGADVAVSITGIAGPDGGTRGEAGRLRLLQRPPRRRHRDRPRAGDPGRPRGHPRTLGPGRDAPAAGPPQRRRVAALGGCFEAARKSAQSCRERGLTRAPRRRSVERVRRPVRIDGVRISLYRSELQPSGARYVPLAQVQLPGPGWQ